MGRIIGWWSAGVTSAVACKLAMDKFGADRVDLYYFKIDSAHEDNKRFIDDCQEWYGKEINILQGKYKDQFDVIEKTRYINGPSGARCTSELKKALRQQIEKQVQYDHQVFGFEFSKREINRAFLFREQHPHTRPYFPLIEREITKNDAAGILAKNGIEMPTMYKLGYPNNNCIGCVKGGGGYWNKIRKDFPETFLRMASLEREIGHSCIRDTFLDELDPNRGNKNKIVMPDCGVFCEVEFEDLIVTKEAKEIYERCGM